MVKVHLASIIRAIHTKLFAWEWTSLSTYAGQVEHLVAFFFKLNWFPTNGYPIAPPSRYCLLFALALTVFPFSQKASLLSTSGGEDF